MQCIALLDLAGNSGTEQGSIFQVCRQLVNEIADQVAEMSRQPNSLSIQSMISDDDAHEDRQDEPVGIGVTPFLSPGFSAVLGCDDAKAALFENIILPLRCDPATHQAIFRGDYRLVCISFQP